MLMVMNASADATANLLMLLESSHIFLVRNIQVKV